MKMTNAEKFVVGVLIVFVIAVLWVGYSNSFPKVYSTIENALIETVETMEDEYVKLGGVIELRENEGNGIFRYEILTDDGNVWVFASKEFFEEQEDVLVSFYTGNKTDKTLWEILEVNRI